MCMTCRQKLREGLEGAGVDLSHEEGRTLERWLGADLGCPPDVEVCQGAGRLAPATAPGHSPGPAHLPRLQRPLRWLTGEPELERRCAAQAFQPDISAIPSGCIA
jgi:hypothetical protein